MSTKTVMKLLDCKKTGIDCNYFCPLAQVLVIVAFMLLTYFYVLPKWRLVDLRHEKVVNQRKVCKNTFNF